ncbi:MAG: hypothetical protein IPK04_06555 [Bdellovibrionales bacterium]|nr:hypothetical protein [Bdellovibrionales bacterium]
MFDTIVVGSGPAGTAAALALKNTNVLVLDIGNVPPPHSLDGKLFQLKREKKDLFREFIGDSFESLHNIFLPYLSPKLKGPLFNYVVKNYRNYFPIDDTEFAPLLSTAKGGLANAWGAGLMRFSDEELSQFPIDYKDLKVFYDELSSHIGISGANDDVAQFVGDDEILLEPVVLPKVAAAFLSRYEKRREILNKGGTFSGAAQSGSAIEGSPRT